mgnify:CR=1 FL=1
MDYAITYIYKGQTHKILLQDMQNILAAIGQFQEDHVKGSRITKIEEY